MATAGISTLGIKFGYGVGATTPSAYTVLTRINSIGELALSTEQIDASALEDMISKYIAGRADTGGSLDVSVNLTDETMAEWRTLIDAYKSKGASDNMYFEIWSPYLTTSFVIQAQPPQKIPVPASDQNGLWTATFSLIVQDYDDNGTSVEPKAAGGQ